MVPKMFVIMKESKLGHFTVKVTGSWRSVKCFNRRADALSPAGIGIGVKAMGASNPPLPPPPAGDSQLASPVRGVSCCLMGEAERIKNGLNSLNGLSRFVSLCEFNRIVEIMKNGTKN